MPAAQPAPPRRRACGYRAAAAASGHKVTLGACVDVARDVDLRESSEMSSATARKAHASDIELDFRSER
jgi:hypothetical protein